MTTILWLGMLAALWGSVESTMETKNKFLPDTCFLPPICNPVAKYRTIDGSCNNLLFPNWGKSETTYIRYKTSDTDYDENLKYDGYGIERSNSRIISRKLFTDGNENNAAHNIHFTITAQSLAHDTSNAKNSNPAEQCCSEGYAIVNRECASIPISDDDPVYAPYDMTCIGVQKTVTTRDSGCIVKEPKNKATSFLDLSQIYGTNDDEEDDAREWKRGLLRTRSVNDHDYLPIEPTNANCEARATVCHAGDNRVDQNLGITHDTTIWVRWHNYIAGLIKKRKPLWTDSILFEETRALAIATFQNVIYSEWLPLAIPSIEVKRVTQEQYYDPLTHPGTLLEFATGCFRLLHSMVVNEFPVKNAEGVIVEKLPLAEWMQRSDIMDDEEFLSQFSYGASEPCQQRDQIIAPDIHNDIFKHFPQNKSSPLGADLITTDMTRARELNVASYPAMVKQVLDLDISSWDDIYATNFFADEDIVQMQRVYPRVNSIEFYAATSLEGKVSGSLWGPTCTKLVSEQFYNWRVGDRWWFDLVSRPYPWNTKQLNVIYNTSFAYIKCKALGLDFVYENSFLVGSDDNKILACRDFPDWPVDVFFDPLPL